MTVDVAVVLGSSCVPPDSTSAADGAFSVAGSTAHATLAHMNVLMLNVQRVSAGSVSSTLSDTFSTSSPSDEHAARPAMVSTASSRAVMYFMVFVMSVV